MQALIVSVAPLFSNAVAAVLGLAAGALISFAQIVLLRDVFRKKIQPSLLSWLGWGLLMGTSLISQILEGGWQWSLTGLLLSSLGCILIFALSWVRDHYLFHRSDWIFLLLGMGCLIIYLISKNAWYTTLFAILADFIVGIPTIFHAYRNPLSQKTMAWALGFFSWAISLLICIGHDWLYALFPLYLFIYNGILYYYTGRVPAADKEKM